MKVSWFSAGVSSAVATKLAMPVDLIVYQHIDDQHPDTLRFIADCEKWFGQKIEIRRAIYSSVEQACMAAAFICGQHGAACSRLLKKRPRKEWEIENRTEKHTYIWGLDQHEINRMEGFLRAMPQAEHLFPLIDNKITKEEAHQILKASGIKRPAMYDLGYNNNNCIGCVRGGMGYWNKIRCEFPEVFKARAKMERTIGASCINGTYLDELDPEAGRGEKIILDDCGLFCELKEIK